MPSFSRLQLICWREFYAALRQVYDTKGEPGHWQKDLQLLLPDENLPGEEAPSREIAECHAKLGQKEKALDVIETHFDEMTVWATLKFDPRARQPPRRTPVQSTAQTSRFRKMKLLWKTDF